MAQGKTRTVRLYEPRIDSSSDGLRVPDSQFWSSLHRTALATPTERRQVTFRGTEFAGKAEVVNGTRCFRLGRRRKQADFPQNEVSADEVGPLPDGIRLIEPMYLVPFGQTGVAMIRTTGGPSVSAAERWLARFIPSLGADEALSLIPILKRGALEKLERAVDVKQMSVKVEPGAELPDDTGGVLAALQAVAASTHHDASVSLEVSFGRKKPYQGRGEALRSTLQRLANRPGVKHSSARLLLADDEGGLTTDYVDFIKDAVTHRIPVGESEAEQPSPEGMVSAALEAIEKYRRQ